jgi:hypothetical protein
MENVGWKFEMVACTQKLKKGRMRIKHIAMLIILVEHHQWWNMKVST